MVKENTKTEILKYLKLNNNDKASKFAKDLIDLDLILLWLKK